MIALGALLLAVAQPAANPHAASPVEVPALASAFREICLDHLGDPLAQTREAFAAPWSFTADGRTEDGEARFRSARGTLGISEPNGSCALTGTMETRVDLTGFQAAMAAALPLGQGSPLSPNSVYWLISPEGGGGQFVIALMVSNETGRNLATLSVQKR